MRFLKVLMGVVLVASLVVNVVLILKYRNTRPIIKVNGEGFSKLDLTSYLEGQAGMTVKAQMVERMLTEQEATKQGVLPTLEEVDEAFAEMKEEDFMFARESTVNPWRVAEAKRQIRQKMAQNRLRMKDVTVTDEQIKELYSSNKMAIDTPNKAKCELAALLDPAVAGPVKELMEKQTNPTVIMQQFPRKVTFLGDANVFVFRQPFGNTQVNKEIMTLKPNQVIQLPATPQLARQGIQGLVVRLIEITPGKPADLNDSKTKEKLKTAIALQRAKPWQEKLSEMWANAKFESEDPNDRKLVEYVLFPDRAVASAR